MAVDPLASPTGAADTPARESGEVEPVVVIGAGLAGLLAAAELRRRGVTPLVLEAAPQAGGVARTVREDGFVLEPAASSMLLPNPRLGPILDSLAITPVAAHPAARRRFVFERGRLIGLGESPAVLAAPVAGAAAKLRAAAEPWVRAPAGGAGTDESLATFARRRFGRDIGDLLSTVAAHGVFAADPEILSVRAAFPALAALEDDAGSVVRGGVARLRARPKGVPRPAVHVLAGGMLDLADAATAALGDRLRLDWPVLALERDGDAWSVTGPRGSVRATDVIVATPAGVAARLLPGDAGDAAAGIATSPVVVVGLGAPAASLPLPEGFGALVGPHGGVRALGVLFESQYAPGRAPTGHHLAKIILGGGADPDIVGLDDDALVEVARYDTSRVLGATVRPTWTAVVRHAPGIPQYGPGHVDRVRRIDDGVAEHPGLHVTGWSYRGIGVAGLAAEAAALADRIVTSG